jgi:hypothetical protein
VTKETTDEQKKNWKNELAIAMDNEQWQHALKLCGWLRYALRQQDSFDPDVDEAHRQAKDALARQLVREKTVYEKHQKHRHLIMYQIISREWEQALTSIEAHYKDGANRQEAINLLQEFKGRTRTLLTNNWRQKDPQVAALGRQFDELVEQVASGSNEIKNSLQGDSIGDNY